MVADLEAGDYVLCVRVAFSCGEEDIDCTFALPIRLE